MAFFQPADAKEHARGNRGEDVSDWCRNCRQPFMAHHNGECPPDEEDEDARADLTTRENA